MNEIDATVQKITRGVKSGERAREIVARFFQDHDAQTNWELIGAFRSFTQKKRTGRKAKKKIADIETEILNYLYKISSDDSGEITKEIIGGYENILLNALEDILTNGKDLELVFIPYFYPHPKALLLLEKAEVTTIKQFLSCDPSTLANTLDGNDELAGELFFLFQMVGFFPETIN